MVLRSIQLLTMCSALVIISQQPAFSIQVNCETTLFFGLPTSVEHPLVEKIIPPAAGVLRAFGLNGRIGRETSRGPLHIRELDRSEVNTNLITNAISIFELTLTGSAGSGQLSGFLIERAESFEFASTQFQSFPNNPKSLLELHEKEIQSALLLLGHSKKKVKVSPLLQAAPLPVLGHEDAWAMLPLLGANGVFGPEVDGYGANYGFRLLMYAQEYLGRQATTPKKVLVLGAGSGYEAIALARLFPQLQIDATDISDQALEVGRLNAVLYEVESRVHFFKSDLFDHVTATYDSILFNSPRAIFFEDLVRTHGPIVGNELYKAKRTRPDLFDIEGKLLYGTLTSAKSHLNPNAPLFLMTEEKHQGYSSYPFTDRLHFAGPWSDKRQWTDTNFGIHEIHYLASPFR